MSSNLVWNVLVKAWTIRHKLQMWEKTHCKYSSFNKWSTLIEVIRRNIRTARTSHEKKIHKPKIPYGKSSARRKIHTAKFSYRGIYIQQKINTAKNANPKFFTVKIHTAKTPATVAHTTTETEGGTDWFSDATKPAYNLSGVKQCHLR